MFPHAHLANRCGARNTGRLPRGTAHPASKQLTGAKPLWHARALGCVSVCMLLAGSRISLSKHVWNPPHAPPSVEAG